MVLLQTIKEVSGANHTIILDIHGNVWARGNNTFGQLGLGHWNQVLYLEKIPSIPKIIDIRADNNCTIMLDENQKIWVCGENNDGQLQLGHFDNVCIPQRL